MPLPRHKIGDEIEILCPDCDAEEEIMKNCQTCNKTGKIKGKITKQ
jgi:hypothetical protein